MKEGILMSAGVGVMWGHRVLMVCWLTASLGHTFFAMTQEVSSNTTRNINQELLFTEALFLKMIALSLRTLIEMKRNDADNLALIIRTHVKEIKVMLASIEPFAWRIDAADKTQWSAAIKKLYIEMFELAKIEGALLKLVCLPHQEESWKKFLKKSKKFMHLFDLMLPQDKP